MTAADAHSLGPLAGLSSRGCGLEPLGVGDTLVVLMRAVHAPTAVTTQERPRGRSRAEARLG